MTAYGIYMIGAGATLAAAAPVAFWGGTLKLKLTLAAAVPVAVWAAYRIRRRRKQATRYLRPMPPRHPDWGFRVELSEHDRSRFKEIVAIEEPGRNSATRRGAR